MALTDNLIAYYKLDEASGNRADSVGVNTLTDVNTVGSAAGIIGNGSSHVRASNEHFSNTTLGLLLGNAFTVSTWINVPDLGAVNQAVWSFRPSSGSVNIIQLEIGDNGSTAEARLIIIDSAGTNKKDYKIGSVPYSTFCHLVVTWDGTNLILYRDATVPSTTKTVDLAATLTATSRTFRLGAESATANIFDGKLDEVAIWTRAVTASEVTQLYNGGAGLPYSSFLSPIMGTTTAVTNISQTSATFNGDVTSDNGATITARGFVYSLTATPTLANSVVVASGTTGTYSASVTGLTVNTTYYVRAYATNSAGTTYSNEVSFTTLAITSYEIQKDIDTVDGDTLVGQITVTGTLGTITVQLGTTGTSTVINAGAGATAFSGTYSGLSGLIITRSATFNGTIDNVYYTKVALGTVVDWTRETVTILTPIPSEVFFKRVEDQIFNNFRFYRYLDLLFKDLDGYVTVTVRQEREDATTEKTKTFVVGNVGDGTVSPFQKKRISFLCKNQAIIIGLSNENLSETFSIAQYLLTGDKKPRRTISPSKIISIS